MLETRRKRIAAALLACAWMGVIFSLSALPGSAVPGRYGTLAHFLSYAVLGALYLLALPKTEPWWVAAVIAVTLASLYGVTDELHQAFVPGRVPDPADWLVDTAGALASVLLIEAIRAHRRQPL